MRYQNKFSLINDSLLYRKKFLDRGVKFIRYEQVPDLIYPTQEQISDLEILTHTWKSGDRLYKLAHKFYGDPSLWWVIAFFNKGPTESYYSFGTVVEIPTPIETVLTYIGY
jgi:hypothetical protein